MEFYFRSKFRNLYYLHFQHNRTIRAEGIKEMILACFQLEQAGMSCGWESHQVDSERSGKNTPSEPGSPEEQLGPDHILLSSYQECQTVTPLKDITSTMVVLH